jgi:putative aldouronate transport system substrate-binding protein
MKRLMLVALCLAMTVSLFAGGNSAKGSTESTGTASTARIGAKGSLPISDGKTTLSVFASGIGNFVTSYNYEDNLFTKRVVDETGIKLAFTAVNGADRNAKLNVLLNSGSYPDLILGGMGLNDMNFYATQGIIIPLDSYDPLSYPNIATAFKEYPALDQVVRGADGKMYGLPSVNDCLHCRLSWGRAWYYMPFIRDNNLKAPENLDQFRDYLRYVRDNDVNRNGDKNDEIPLAFSANELKNVIALFAKAYMPFVYTGSYFGLALNGKNVVEQYRDNKFREALRYINGLYKEGLIAEDSFSMTVDQLKALSENPGTPIVATASAIWQSGVAVRPSERWIEFFHVPELAGPTGERYGPNQDPWSIMGSGMHVTDKCKDPELAVALYNYFLNFDVMLDGYIGPKGVAWTDPDPGSIALGGGKPFYKLLMGFGAQPVNIGWDQGNPMVRNNDFRMGEQALGADMAQKWLATGDPSLRDTLLKNGSFNEMNNYMVSLTSVPWEIPSTYFIPPLALNDDDNARMADINAVLNSYKDQAFTEFIIGTRDINNNTAWNAYLADLDRLGSKELASILQKYIK